MNDPIEDTATKPIPGQTANFSWLLGERPDQTGPSTALDLVTRLNQRLALNSRVFLHHR
jgi:hypothetical protein